MQSVEGYRRTLTDKADPVQKDLQRGRAYEIMKEKGTFLVPGRKTP